MNIWLQGLQVALIGMSVVFIGLVILIGVIGLLKTLSVEKRKSQPAEESGFILDLPLSNVESDIQQTADDLAIAAAITAALQCILSAETEAPHGFIVRRIRRIA